MGKLRPVFFVVALTLSACIVLVEIGALAFGRGSVSGITDLAALIPPEGKVRDAYAKLDRDELAGILAQGKPPGLAIPYMALLDGAVFFTMALIGVSLLLRERIHARVQGIATLAFSALVLLTAIGLIRAALAELILRVALFLAAPFGTLVYLANYGFFNRAGALAALGLLMALKLGFAICLVLAHPRFLQNRGLALIIVTSFLGNAVISFLHGIAPGFLVSVTDAIAAIVVAVLAAIWATVLLAGAAISVLKALRLGRT